jgi:sarcosine oxidase
MAQKFDAIVIGLGAMGSAALYQLAKKGNKALGLDQFSPPHIYGSTHGETRITRLAIGEGSHYTPLVQRSHELWREIERETGKNLLTSNGGLIISSGAGAAVNHVAHFFENTIAAAKEHRIAHELLKAETIRKRFPQFKIKDNESGYFEREAGFVRPEECVSAQLGLAGKYGAEIHTQEKVLAYKASGDVKVTTDQDTYTAEKLVITAGPWVSQLMDAEYSHHFKVLRQVLFWFDIENSYDHFTPDRFPVFIWELPDNSKGLYGFPAINGPKGGLKIASEQNEMTTTPQTVNREVSPKEIRDMYEELVAPHIAEVAPKCLQAASCLYTVTPDAGFVIDFHPKHPSVVIASPCSGHGFKHSAAIGEVLSEMVVHGRSRFDTGKFGLNRDYHD